MKTRFRIVALGSTAMILLLSASNVVSAQSARPDGASPLPPVVVSEPGARRAVRPAVRRAAPARRIAVRPAARPPVARDLPVAVVENPRGPIQGYVANRSLSGTKTDTPINETPQAISVVGAEQIRDQQPAKLDEVLRYSPGVVAGTFGADVRNDWFLIRGLPAQEVGLFLDGMQLFETSFATWKLQPFNLERVEVLRGPSAVLYGGSSPSGIINAVSKLPPQQPIRFIEAGVNNYGNRYINFDIGGPVETFAPQNGQLLYRLVGQIKNGDTQTDFTPDNNYFLAPSLTWISPDRDTRFTVLGSVSQNFTRPQNFLPYEGTVTNAPFGRIRTSVFTGEPFSDTFSRKQEMIGYQFERNLNESLTFRQNARYAHVDVKLSTWLGAGYAGSSATANLNRFNFLAIDSADQATLDNQLEYRVLTGPLAHKVLFGVDLKYYNIADKQNFDFGILPINVVNPVYTQTGRATNPFRDVSLTQKQVGVYLQDQIKLDRFTLVLSGRNDWVETSNDNRLGADQSRNDSKFSGRAGLIYNFDIGLAPYVSYATSYNPVVGLNTSVTPNTLQLPETGQQAEVGVKYQPTWLNGHFGVALFDLKRQNVITNVPNTVPVLQAQNGEQTSRGLELEAVANVMPGLKVIGTYTNYDLFISKDGDPTLVGKVPFATPRQIATAWMDYTFQDGPMRGFGFGGGVRYVGSSFADAANTLVVPSFTLADLALHYEWAGGWRAAVNFQNIGDKIYVASCQGVNACFYGDRRRVTGSLSYRW